MEGQDQPPLNYNDMSLAGFSAAIAKDKYSQEVLKKFHWAIKRVTSEHGTDNDTALTPEELIKLIQTWEPQRDIICLYVRWSRQLRRNFNLDSIATLLCLSRQCGYSPLDFLRKVKTLSVHRNKKNVYGVTFSFDIPNRKDVNRERLNKEFLGLSVTLALLQEQVTDLPSILGKTKMRQIGPRKDYPIGIHLEDKDKKPAAITTQPNTEFHTQSSLLNRIWISINHRWLALYLTEHIFRVPTEPWSYQEGLVYSFQMMASCGPGRYEFLSPLVGYCLRFSTQDCIDSKRERLRAIWKDPSSFLPYGQTCLTQFSSDAQSRIILTCFQELRADIPTTVKSISYNRDCTWLRRWTILRAYIYHFWLDSATNAHVKSLVTNSSFSTTRRKKKRSVGDCCDSKQSCTDKISLSDSFSTEVKCARSPMKRKASKNGMNSILSSRRITTAVTTDSHCENAHSGAATSTSSAMGIQKNESTQVITHNIDHCGTLFHGNDWTRLRLVSPEQLQHFIQSYLLIYRSDGVVVLSELSPMEVYSANHLHDWTHCRISGPSPFFPSGRVGDVSRLHVNSASDHFIDTYGKSYHVARERSVYFSEHSHHMPMFADIQVLCNAITRYGKIDSKRAVGQYRVNLGNGGQNWESGAPCQLHGLQFQKSLEEDSDFDACAVLASIGQIVEFTWKVACSLQEDASDHPIAPDIIRKKLYAATLNRYLHMDAEVGFEDVTLVVSSLYPVAHDVFEHKDLMNDTLAGYTRTATFNMVMIDDNDRRPMIVHFQVVCNFRKVIGRYIIPFRSYLSNVAKHARQYLDKWQRNSHLIYAGKVDKVPCPYDRSSFFLDDCLDYTVIALSEDGKHKQSISSEYLLMEVNISRTLSFSMFIDPIVKMQPFLKFDQTIELAFACSFLSNPFWFNWSMCTLIRRLEDPNNSFQLELHPFYDWCSCTMEIFGTWQGGPYNRWSPCGGSKETVLETFGAQPDASRKERQLGERKLAQVVSILFGHVEWINSLVGCGDIPMVDMPLATMKARCNETVKAIADVASCQFSHFRLGILTTILSGCGLLREGRHLRNCMYPVKGSASYKHLSFPVADCMSNERASALGENRRNETISNDGEGCVDENQHDLFMQYLSVELGFKRLCQG